ncbi:MAG: alpha/beta hydrolase [Pseudomonadota bacterium]
MNGRHLLRLAMAIIAFAMPQIAMPQIATSDAECVVLLHGLARTAKSMEPMARRLEAEGYRVINQAYPSRQHEIAVLAERYVREGVDACGPLARIHFVTHSLGGILVRQYLSKRTVDGLGHTVMLAPPNQGSEVVDNWQHVPGYDLLNGPAGRQLGTDGRSVPLALGPVTYPVGIVAGTRSINVLLSLSLPNPDDGKVSVASTKVAGMADHIEVPQAHPLIMRSERVQDQVVHFLAHGAFAHSVD